MKYSPSFVKTSLGYEIKRRKSYCDRRYLLSCHVFYFFPPSPPSFWINFIELHFNQKCFSFFHCYWLRRWMYVNLHPPFFFFILSLYYFLQLVHYLPLLTQWYHCSSSSSGFVSGFVSGFEFSFWVHIQLCFV